MGINHERIIHIRDSNRYPDPAEFIPCQDFIWQYDRQPCSADITVLVDRHIQEIELNNSKIKIAWLLEPPVIDGLIYEYAFRNKHKFHKILTFSKELVSTGEPFIYYPHGTTWIKPENRKIHPKSEIISMIASAKNFTLGHKLRHTCAQFFKNQIHLMGNGYQTIPDKIIGLSPYKYHLTIENCQYDDYFTEKLLDCFCTGTIPIYWGCKNIENYFDGKGIIRVNSIEEIKDALTVLSEEDYERRKEAIKNNLYIAEKYVNLDKTIWDICLNRFF
jgi:hypothetical protein